MGTAEFSSYTADSLQLSVVVTIGARRWRALRCLDAILAQAEAPRTQVVVVDVYPAGGRPDRPGIDYLPLLDCASIPAAKAAGAQAAAGPVIAFLEDHCVPEPGWAAAIVRTFNEHPDVAAVAYSFGNLNPVNWVSRSFLLLAYGPWMGPVGSGPVATPSWMNVAYSRETLSKLENIPGWLGCEGLFLHRLRRAGAQFRQAGDARVRHLNHPGLLGSAKDSACWQRLFAATRVEIEEWSWFRRVAYFCGAIPFSPSIITIRLGQRLWIRPELRRPFLEALPLILFVYTWGAFSEALGYVAGAGDSAFQTIYVETGDPRGEAP